MNEYKMSVGQATYKIQRQYKGKKNLTELLVEQLLQKQLPKPGFDDSSARKV